MSQNRQQALTQLNQLMQERLPTPDQPDVDYILFLQPLKVSSLGVGGFVAVHNDPIGDIYGCLIHAEAIVTVTVQTTALNEAISMLTTTLLGLDSQQLRQQGIFRLQLQPVEPFLPTALAHNVTFDLLYEYQQVPTEAGDIIQEIPLNINLE